MTSVRMTTAPLSRRAVLGGAAGATAALLTGCGATASDPAGSARGAPDVALPTYRAYDAVNPDIAPVNEYAQPGFLKYPAPAIEGIPEKPGDGSTITGFAATSVSTATPMGDNGWWQNVNERLGVTLDLQWLRAEEYTAKLQTLLASDDLPEVVLINPLPKLDQVLQSKFTALDDYLAGDAVTDYPMLSDTRTAAWRETMFGGSIYGIPRPLAPIGARLAARTDTLDELGVQPEFGDAEEFFDFCVEVTDRSAGRFAMVQPHATFFKTMFSLPNDWERTDEGFRHAIESPRYLDYLDYVTRMWSAGLFHPESFQTPSLVPMFQKPAFLLYEVSGAGFTKAMPIYRPGAPTLTVKPVPAPLAEGGGIAPVPIGPASAGMLSLRKGLEPDRVKLILNVLNYIAAAFGTQEHLHVQYGKEGHNYTLDEDGQPEANPKITNELFPITRFPGTSSFLYAPGFPEVTEAECAFEQAVAGDVVLDASAGLYSETAIDKQQQLDRDLTMAVGDIIQGRTPVSDWPKVVQTWAGKGGDQIRQEYEAQQ